MRYAFPARQRIPLPDDAAGPARLRGRCGWSRRSCGRRCQGWTSRWSRSAWTKPRAVFRDSLADATRVARNLAMALRARPDGPGLTSGAGSDGAVARRCRETTRFPGPWMRRIRLGGASPLGTQRRMTPPLVQVDSRREFKLDLWAARIHVAGGSCWCWATTAANVTEGVIADTRPKTDRLCEKIRCITRPSS